MEYEVDSFADFEAKQAAMFADPEFGPWFGKMTDLVIDGRRDFFNIVE